MHAPVNNQNKIKNVTLYNDLHYINAANHSLGNPPTDAMENASYPEKIENAIFASELNHTVAAFAVKKKRSRDDIMTLFSRRKLANSILNHEIMLKL